jgi:catechol 2,3-dioxygenase-like lactoylglutathione lyase family enzyme
MTITLNHTIVPARDKKAAARFFARIFGLRVDRKDGHFAPVRINDALTLLFDDTEEFESHHYAFHVSDAEFDAGAFARRSWPMAAPRGASTMVSSTTGTVAAASIFVTPMAMSSN